MASTFLLSSSISTKEWDVCGFNIISQLAADLSFQDMTDFVHLGKAKIVS